VTAVTEQAPMNRRAAPPLRRRHRRWLLSPPVTSIPRG
jgi:hypothetical protein